MLTKTSRSAIRLLTYLGQLGSSEPLSPRTLAERLGESPTYLAKVAGHLVRAGILQSQRGVAGGMILSRSPDTITLLAIVEACQGAILADFCDETPDLAKTCALHQACAELHDSIVGVLSRWTLAQFIQKPRPTGMVDKRIPCWLEPTPRLTPLRTPVIPATGSRQAAGKVRTERRSTPRKTSQG
ncbi:MAG: Rrf2 family transcriptional regulator [Pirellulaceae bacterium]|jgi:Rrf2 family protein|nr:Rrf2 family transcriptional regulator [Pirellulaceae bacterium]